MLDKKCGSGGFEYIFGGFRKFTEKNEGYYQIQCLKIFKIPNFQLGASKIPLFGVCV